MKTSIKRISKKVNTSSEANLLIKAAKNAGKNAIRTSKALGLDITYLKNGVIYKEKANGETVVFKGNQANDTPKISLRKGMTLNAKN